MSRSVKSSWAPPCLSGRQQERLQWHLENQDHCCLGVKFQISWKLQNAWNEKQPVFEPVYPENLKSDSLKWPSLVLSSPNIPVPSQIRCFQVQLIQKKGFRRSEIEIKVLTEVRKWGRNQQNWSQTLLQSWMTEISLVDYNRKQSNFVRIKYFPQNQMPFLICDLLGFIWWLLCDSTNIQNKSVGLVLISEPWCCPQFVNNKFFSIMWNIEPLIINKASTLIHIFIQNSWKLSSTISQSNL